MPVIKDKGTRWFCNGISTVPVAHPMDDLLLPWKSPTSPMPQGLGFGGPITSGFVAVRENKDEHRM